MANRHTGWKGSGSRPGSRRRDKSKGTVYWIDLPYEKDQRFKAFAEAYGMDHREAAKALIAVAAGLLPSNFWDSEEMGGYTPSERTNLIRQVFPKGSGHTNRGPHAVWKSTWDKRVQGQPGGIDFIGLIIEREKMRLQAIANAHLDDEALDEEEAREQQEYARQQLLLLEEQNRLHMLERGLIVTGRKDVEDNDYDDEYADEAQKALKGKGKGISNARRVDRIRPTGQDLDPYARERRKSQARIQKLKDEEVEKLQARERLVMKVEEMRARFEGEE